MFGRFVYDVNPVFYLNLKILKQHYEKTVLSLAIIGFYFLRKN